MHNDINIIVAVDNDGGFGKDGKIPWHIPEDFKHFQKTTKGHVCIMGRRTYEDMAEMVKSKKKKIGKSILPNRKCYVLTSSEEEFEGATPVKSLRKVCEMHQDERIFVLGGEKLFVQALSWARNIYMTVIDHYFNCDKFFPVDVLHKSFKIVDGSTLETKKDKYSLYIIQYQRK